MTGRGRKFESVGNYGEKERETERNREEGGGGEGGGQGKEGFLKRTLPSCFLLSSTPSRSRCTRQSLLSSFSTLYNVARTREGCC